MTQLQQIKDTIKILSISEPENSLQPKYCDFSFELYEHTFKITGFNNQLNFDELEYWQSDFELSFIDRDNKWDLSNEDLNDMYFKIDGDIINLYEIIKKISDDVYGDTEAEIERVIEEQKDWDDYQAGLERIKWSDVI